MGLTLQNLQDHRSAGIPFWGRLIAAIPILEFLVALLSSNFPLLDNFKGFLEVNLPVTGSYWKILKSKWELLVLLPQSIQFSVGYKF